MNGAVEAAVQRLGSRLALTVEVVELVDGGRTDQYSAGRRAARSALARAGATDLDVARADDGRPCWPPGWMGSIAHGAGFAVAAVTADGRALGVDIEVSGGLTPDEATLVLDTAELALARAADDAALMTTLLWSAKESAFKAWSGALGGLPDVDPREIHIDVDVATDGLAATATGSLSARVGALGLSGCYSVDAAVTVTVVVS